MSFASYGSSRSQSLLSTARSGQSSALQQFISSGRSFDFKQVTISSPSSYTRNFLPAFQSANSNVRQAFVRKVLLNPIEQPVTILFKFVSDLFNHCPPVDTTTIDMLDKFIAEDLPYPDLRNQWHSLFFFKNSDQTQRLGLTKNPQLSAAFTKHLTAHVSDIFEPSLPIFNGGKFLCFALHELAEANEIGTEEATDEGGSVNNPDRESYLSCLNEHLVKTLKSASEKEIQGWVTALAGNIDEEETGLLNGLVDALGAGDPKAALLRKVLDPGEASPEEDAMSIDDDRNSELSAASSGEALDADEIPQPPDQAVELAAAQQELIETQQALATLRETSRAREAQQTTQLEQQQLQIRNLETHQQALQVENVGLRASGPDMQEQKQKLAAQRQELDGRAAAVEQREAAARGLANTLTTARETLEREKAGVIEQRAALERERTDLQQRYKAAMQDGKTQLTVEFGELRRQLEGAVADKETALAGREQELTRGQTELADGQAKLGADRALLVEGRDMQVAAVKAEAQKVQATAKRIQSRVGDLEAALDELQGRLGEAEGQHLRDAEALATETETHAAVLATQERTHADALTQAHTERDEARATTGSVRSENATLQGQLAGVRQELATLNGQLAEQGKVHTDELSQVRAERDALTAQLEGLKHTHADELAQIQQEAARQVQTAQTATVELDAVRNELAQVRSDADTAKADTVRATEVRIADLTTQLTEARAETAQAAEAHKAALSEVRAQLGAAREENTAIRNENATLQERPTKQALEKAVHQANENTKGEINTVKEQSQGILHRLEERLTQETANHAAALGDLQKQLEAKNTELLALQQTKGATEADNAKIAAERDGLSAENTQQGRELAEVKQELAAVKDEAAREAAAHTAARDELQTGLTASRAETEAVRAQNVQQGSSLAKVRQELTEAGERAGKAESDLAAQIAANTALQGRLGEATRATETARNEATQAAEAHTKALALKDKDIAELRQQAAAAGDRHTQAFTAERQAKEHLQAELKERTTALSEMQNENTALQSELGTLRPRLSELEQQLTIAQREQVAAERRATTAETARDRAQQGTQAAAVSVTQANARADAANTAMQQAIQERASAIEEKDRAIAAEQAAKGEVQVARGEARIARREATEAQQQLMEAAHLSEIKKGEVETRNTTIRDLQTAIQGLQSNETKSTEQHRAALAEQTQARETLQQQFDTKTRDFNLLAEKMKELQQNLAQKTAALATAEQTAQARATIQIQEAQQNAKREIAQIQHSLDEITAVKDTLSTQLAEAKEQIKALQLQNFGERHTIMRKALNATLISTTVPPRPPNMATTKIYSELDELDNIGTPPPPAPTTIEPLSTPLQTARVLSQIPGASPPPRTPGSAHRPTPRTQQRVENRRPG